MSCHFQRIWDRERYFTSNCGQKNISQAQLLTFLMLLALYLIKFLISGRRKPWFLIQHDDDDGARTQNYWKYLIKKYRIYVLLPSKLQPKKKMFKQIISLNIYTRPLVDFFPKCSVMNHYLISYTSSKFQCLPDAEIQLKF